MTEGYRRASDSKVDKLGEKVDELREAISEDRQKFAVLSVEFRESAKRQEEMLLELKEQRNLWKVHEEKLQEHSRRFATFAAYCSAALAVFAVILDVAKEYLKQAFSKGGH